MSSEIFSKIGRVYFKVIEGVAAGIIVLVALNMLGMVASRAIFNFWWSAIDKINIIAMIWVCFLMAGLLVETEGHVSITYLKNKLTGLRLAFLNLFVHLSILAAFIISAYFGFFIFMELYEANTCYPAEIDIPQWLAYVPVFIGMVLGIPLVLHVLIKNISVIRRELVSKKKAGKG